MGKEISALTNEETKVVTDDSAVGTLEGDIYSSEQLATMKVSEIKSLAANLGYSLNSVKKSDIITEFMTQQSK